MESNEKLRDFCSKNPTLVKTFGRPYEWQDDDHYSRWWEFVAFDGVRWQPFHLGDDFRISSEPFLDVNDRGSRAPNFVDLVYDEFSKATSLTA